MAIARNRDEFKKKCLRRLGWPILTINLDDEHIEDAIDYSLKYFRDYHYDGSEKVYYKMQITQNNMPRSVHSVTVLGGGQNYSNTDTVVFTSQGGSGNGAVATITTDANGTIVDCLLSANGNGDDYVVAPTISITTSTGTGATLRAELGGWFPIPDNIFGIVRIFDLSSAIQSSNIFNVQYQFIQNEIYTWSSTYSMVPYYVSLQYMNMISQLLVGLQEIRYNRHRNRMYIDMNWNRWKLGDWVIAEAYEAMDPDEFKDLWDDRWLIQYTASQIKRTWGEVLKKFNGTVLIGNQTFSGKEIFEEATREIEKLEKKMLTDFSLPPSFMIG